MRRLSVLGLLMLLAAGCGSGGEAPTQVADRLVIVSVPGVSWADVVDGAMPSLASLATDGATANLATRIGRSEGTTEAAYLTMGAGTRAVAPREGAGVALEPGELYHGEPADFVLARRLGVQSSGVAYLAIGAARDANEQSSYGADVGTLGKLLEDAGIDRAVIANADLGEGRADDDAYGRGAAAVVMGPDGQVPGGEVGRELLVDDPSAPFGSRVDHAQLLAAFDAAWTGGRTVLMIEASDLTRAMEYRSFASADRRREMRDAALAEADALIGDVADRLGEHDAMLVVSPIAPPGAPDLAVVALRAPSVQRGLLVSATTRRDGYVQLADVAPTVLDVLGVKPPTSIEGRPFRVVRQRDAHQLVELDDAGQQAAFRDSVVPATVTTMIFVLVLLTAATILRRRLPAGIVGVIPVLATGSLGALAATFLSAVLGIRTIGLYIVLLIVAGVVVAAVATVADRRVPGAAPIIGVGAVVGLIAVDVTVGAPLQLNTVFGYSVAVAGRFAGLGNLAFALFGAGALVFAALLAERSGTRGPRIAIGILGVALLIDGLPNLGADVGGVLSMVPAFGVAVLVLFGRKIGVREIGGVIGATMAALLGAAFLDLARSDASQTHLARLAQHVLDLRTRPFLDSLERRWSASFGDGQTGAWVVLIVLVAIVAAILLLRLVPERERRALDRTERAAAVGLAVLATLGLAANDSSFAVPFTMLLVVAPVVIHRTVSAEVAG